MKRLNVTTRTQDSPDRYLKIRVEGTTKDVTSVTRLLILVDLVSESIKILTWEWKDVVSSTGLKQLYRRRTDIIPTTMMVSKVAECTDFQARS